MIDGCVRIYIAAGECVKAADGVDGDGFQLTTPEKEGKPRPYTGPSAEYSG